MEVSGQLHAPAALLPGKEPWHPLCVDWVGHVVSADMLEKGNIFSSAGNRKPGKSVAHLNYAVSSSTVQTSGHFRFHFSVKRRSGLAKGRYPMSNCMVERGGFISNCYYHV
jgi:hypothetical protein